MLPQVLGFTVAKTIPNKVLFGVLTGTYQVCGGVIRNKSGQIAAHLVNAVNPRRVSHPADAEFGAINGYQLQRIGRDATRLGSGTSGWKQGVETVTEALAGVKQVIGLFSDNDATLQTATTHLVTLSTGTMLLSGLTLAASAAGFAFLNKKLNKIDRKLEELEKDVKEIKAFLDMRQRGADDRPQHASGRVRRSIG